MTIKGRWREITPPNTTNINPIKFGNRVVYARLPAVGDWLLIAYDLVSRTESVFSTIDRNTGLGAFSMWGDRVVWHTRRNGNWDIYMYDFAIHQERRITTDPADQADPSIYGNRIAWADRRHSTNGWWDAYVYDITTGQETRITENTTLGRSPILGANSMVWGDVRGNGPFSLFEYRFNVVPHERWLFATPLENFIDMSGDKVTWTSRSANETYDDIYVYNVSTGQEVRVTSSAARQWFPTISGQYLVWEDLRNGNADLYGLELSSIFP